MKKEDTIAIYLRLSKEDEEVQTESNSITNQRFLICDYIRQHEKLAVAKTMEYVDDGYSGANFERPSIQRLFDDIKKKRIQCIIVKDLSRFSRDHIELGSYMELIFPFMGIQLISINDHYVSSDRNGNIADMDIYLKTLLYDVYSKELSVSVKASFKEKCDRGEYVFGQTPFGYEKIPNSNHQIHICEKEAAIVRRIFAMAETGSTTTQIAKQFNREQIPTANQMRGKKKQDETIEYHWGSTMIRSILKNRFYIGEWRYHKTTREVGSKKAMYLPPDEWISVAGHHESMVSLTTFEAVQPQQNYPSTKQKNASHPLTGKVYCGGCHHAMVYKKHSKYKRFECAKKSMLINDSCCGYYNAAILEEIILLELNKEIMRYTECSKLAEYQRNELTKQMKILNDKQQTYQKDIQEMERVKQKNYEEYAQGQTDIEAYQDTNTNLAGQINQRIYELKNSTTLLGELREQYRKKTDDIKDFIRYHHVINLNKEMVDAFIEKIYLYSDKRVEIKWKYRNPNVE